MTKVRCHSLTSSEEIRSQRSKPANCGVGPCTRWEEDGSYKVVFFFKAPDILGMPDNILTSL